MIRFLLIPFLLVSLLFAKTPSLEEMIAQMIVIGFDGTKEGEKWVEQIAKDIKREKVGGVILADKNIQNSTQLKKLTDYLKAQAPQSLPLIVSVEYEGDDPSLFSVKKGYTHIYPAHLMATTKDMSEAAQLYQSISDELEKSGINVNFAPVLDLQAKSVTSEDQIKRSYSAYEEIVTTYALLFVDAMYAHNIVPVAKYFPSAGTNLGDDFSHEADITASWRFEQLKPYYDLIAYHKLDAVVMSHAMQKELDENNPALFSKLMIQNLLRDKMHFEGVVFADHLRTNSFPSGVDFKQRIIKTIQAGADILVFTNYFADNASMPFTVQKIITDAIRSGEISKEQIERSYARIVSFKQKLSKRGSHVN